jgi:hypothetical protein
MITGMGTPSSQRRIAGMGKSFLIGLLTLSQFGIVPSGFKKK